MTDSALLWLATPLRSRGLPDRSRCAARTSDRVRVALPSAAYRPDLAAGPVGYLLVVDDLITTGRLVPAGHGWVNTVPSQVIVRNGGGTGQI